MTDRVGGGKKLGGEDGEWTGGKARARQVGRQVGGRASRSCLKGQVVKG